MKYEFTRKDIDFYSEGTRCSAWLYLPETDKKRPVIVMAHGLGYILKIAPLTVGISKYIAMTSLKKQ